MSDHLTPERLSAIRSLYVATRNGYPALMNAESGELLAHIDAQASKLERAEAFIAAAERLCAARELEARKSARLADADALDDAVKAGCDEPVDAADAADWLRAKAESD